VSQRSADWGSTEVEVELFRDYVPGAARIPGMALGVRRLTGPLRPVTAALHREGARYAKIAAPVDVCVDANLSSARALVLIRELTARAVAVEWTARCLDGCVGQGVLDHLYPPGRVEGTAHEALTRRWRLSYFLGKCVFRRGPGFVEVRDRRSGSLEMFTIDSPEHLSAIAAMLEGDLAADIAADVRRELTDAQLVAEQAGHLWWLPTPAYRWPFPALAV
jgi:hypothetical protein